MQKMQQKLVRRPSASGVMGFDTPVDLYTNFESGLNGTLITVADLDAATTKTAAAAGLWSFLLTPAVAPTISTVASFNPAPRKIKVDGVTMSESNRSILHNTAQDQVQCLYTLTTAANAISVGFAFRTPEAQVTFNYYNYGEITGVNGIEFAALHLRDFALMQVAIEDGASNLGALITLSSLTWYWVTMLYDNIENTVKLRFYDTTTWTQVGPESSLSPSITLAANRFNIGRTDNHNVFGTQSSYHDSLAICLSTGVGATFPLLPT